VRLQPSVAKGLFPGWARTLARRVAKVGFGKSERSNNP